jgi:type II secretory pathway component PulK
MTMRSGPPIRAQRGIALILALWLTVMLTVIASGFAFSMRSEALAARLRHRDHVARGRAGNLETRRRGAHLEGR